MGWQGWSLVTACRDNKENVNLKYNLGKEMGFKDVMKEHVVKLMPMYQGNWSSAYWDSPVLFRGTKEAH